MILYHFSTSPFSRRVRLALAHKGLRAELRDARAQPVHARELHELSPFHTVPVLVDGQRVVPDSGAICHYLDRKQPSAPLWPAGLEGAEAFALIALCDGVITPLVDLGLRYASLREHASYGEVRANMVGRVQRGLDELARRSAGRTYLCGEGWSAADMALVTKVIWLETLPSRVETFPPAKRMLDLGWTLPPALSRWADAHREREDVRALDSLT